MNPDEPLQFLVVRKVPYEEIRGGDRTWCVAFTDLHVPECETRFGPREEVRVRTSRLANREQSSLSIAAARLNLSSSPAMLITRQGGRISCALAVAKLSKTSAS